MAHAFHRKRGKFKPAGKLAATISERTTAELFASRRHKPCSWHNLVKQAHNE
jgi:hypothetical protein